VDRIVEKPVEIKVPGERERERETESFIRKQCP
jgi:hypothetical protein